MTQSDCDAVLFDLDGVLIDSTICIERHWRRWVNKYGFDFEQVMSLAHGRRTVETIALVAPYLPAEEEATRFEAAESQDTDGVLQIEGADRLLRSLPAGSWAIATSGTYAVASARLKHTRLLLPEVLVTADDVKEGKPSPQPYLQAARGLGVAPERCVVVEDAPAGVESGRAAGMRVIAIAKTHPPEVLLAADVIVDKLADIQVQPGRDGFRLLLQMR